MKKIAVFVLGMSILAGCSFFGLGDEPAPPGPAASFYNYIVAGMKFKSPITLSSPTSIGTGGNTAYSIDLSGSTGVPRFSAIFYVFPDKTQTIQKAFALAKKTYLGSDKPSAESASRTFFGEKVPGDKEITSGTPPQTLESYIVNLPSGKWLFTGFKYTDEMEANQREKVIDMMTSTLEE